MTIQVPGRTLSDDEDLTGTSPGLEELRWTVIVRDETACDFLGDGRPTERLTVSAGDARDIPASPTRFNVSTWWIVAGAVVALAGLCAYVLRRAR